MIIQRYILKELILTFILSFMAIVAVCAVGIMFQTFRAYEGMTLLFIARLAPLPSGCGAVKWYMSALAP